MLGSASDANWELQTSLMRNCARAGFAWKCEQLCIHAEIPRQKRIRLCIVGGKRQISQISRSRCRSRYLCSLQTRSLLPLRKWGYKASLGGLKRRRLLDDDGTFQTVLSNFSSSRPRPTRNSRRMPPHSFNERAITTTCNHQPMNPLHKVCAELYTPETPLPKPSTG